MKSSRAYSSDLRREQAAATRERVVRAAAELFAERGFAATTLPSIAERAGVSTETVQGHGPKAELLRAAIDLLSFGTGPDAAVLETDLGAALLAAASAAEALRISVDILVVVNGRSSGVWSAFAEAARTDPSLADELAAFADRIRQQNLVVMRHWRAQGWLRTACSDEELSERAAAIGSAELYDRVVRVERRAVEDYRRIVTALLQSLLADQK